MASKTSKWPTLTVVFEDREMKIFFTNPEKIPMSMLNRMQQLVRRELRTHQAQAFAELRKTERKMPTPLMEPKPRAKPEGFSTIEKPPIPITEDAILAELIDETT